MAHEDKSYLASLRRLRRELKYESRSDLIGSEVLIQGYNSVSTDVRAGLIDRVPNIAELNKGGFTGKYTFLDLTFDLEPQPTECRTAKLRLLQEFGYLPKSRQEALEAGPDLDPMNNGTLFVLEEDLDLKKFFLRLYLEPVNENLKNPKRSSFSRRKPTSKQRLKAILEDIDNALTPSFPIPYGVTDAAITNAGSIWLFKHFWM